MTKALKREVAHHNAAAAPEQKGRHRAAAVEATGGEDNLPNSEAQGLIQARAPPSRMLRFVDVIECTGLSRTTIWRRIRAGTFPAPISLGENSVGWPEHAITEWIKNRPVVHYANQEAATA